MMDERSAARAPYPLGGKTHAEQHYGSWLSIPQWRRSISLGDHFEGFITRQIESGRYGSVSEVIRASLRLLEEREKSIGVLRNALVEGEQSGDAGPLNMQEIKHKARAKSVNRA
jgi:antitoxin ParD1/3/4